MPNEEERMKRILWHVVFFFTLLWFAGFPAPVVSAHDEHQHHVHGSTQASAENPLIEEMLVLNNAYRDIVSAVALGDTESVRKAIEPMHGMMEKTHQGMQTGITTLPKNAARAKEFVEQDHKFHDKLDALDRAAHHNNQREMLRIAKQLLDGCVQCHQLFRK
jgi:cytochrome c556